MRKELTGSRSALFDAFVRTNLSRRPYIEGRLFFRRGFTSRRRLSRLRICVIRPGPLAEVSLKCDSEKADARDGRRWSALWWKQCAWSDPSPVIHARVGFVCSKDAKQRTPPVIPSTRPEANRKCNVVARCDARALVGRWRCGLSMMMDCSATEPACVSA